MQVILAIYNEVAIAECPFRHQGQNLALLRGHFKVAFIHGQNLGGLDGGAVNTVPAVQPPVDGRGDVEGVPAFVDVRVPMIDLLGIQHHGNDRRSLYLQHVRH